MKTLFLCCLLAGAVAVQAQDDKHEKHQHPDKKDMHGMHGKYSQFMPQSIFGVGGSFQKFDALNSKVAGSPGYEPLKDAMGTLQLGWLKEKNRTVAASDISIGSSMSGDKGKKSSNIRYIGLGADFGYDLLKEDRMLLYPYAGIGYEWYQARFYKDNSAVDFGDVLDSPDAQNAIRPVNFRNEYFTYRLGLGFTMKSPGHMRGGIGLRAGYTGSFSDREWRGNDNQRLANAPKDGLSRFNVSLILSHQVMKMGH